MMNRQAKTVKKTFLSGVFLLSVSTILVKIVGLFYKIPMLSYLGAEGMGYFNSAYEIYAFFCVVATAGLPVALSVLISAALAKGEERRVKRLYRVALTAFFVIGLLGSVLMAVFAGQFCKLIQSGNAKLSIIAISPTVFFICISSALRGYFQGYGKMAQTAVSQLIEAVGKLCFGLLLARAALLAGRPTHQVAAAAGAGLTLGTLASLVYLLLEKLRFRGAESAKNKEKDQNIVENTEKTGAICLSLAKLAIPITVGAVSVNLTKLIDMTMILRRLQSIGYAEALANEAYGGYTTLALSVYGLLPTLVNSIALPLIPLLSAAIASGNRARQLALVQASYRITALFAVPAAVGISIFAKPILSLLFGGEEAAVLSTAPLLSVLGVSVFLSCMITATNSVLHAYRSVNRPILSLLAGSVVKIIVAYFLIGNPRIGILGAPISSFFCNLIVVLCNLIFADRLCRVPSLWKIFFKPFAFSVVSAFFAWSFSLWLTQRAGEGRLTTLAALGSMVVLYFLLAVLGGGVADSDLAVLPMGKKMLPVLKKIRRRQGKQEGGMT